MSPTKNHAHKAILASCLTTLVLLVLGAGQALAAAPETPLMKVESHTATGVFLHGVLNPGLEPPQEGTYEFIYAASPTTCTGESKARRGLSLGLPSEEVFEEIGGLTPHTTYTICLLHRNLAGEETLSTPEIFTTSYEPETPETNAADTITTNAATLHGTLNPSSSREEEPGFYEFIYKHSASECEGEGSTGQLPATTGQEKETVQTEITSLAPGTQYTACLRAWNTTGQFAQGTPVTFTTSPEGPTVGEEKTSNITTRSANVSAQMTTGGLPVTYTVQYGTTSSYGQETTPVELGPETATVSTELTGLQPGVEYHYRFHITNTQGEQDATDTTLTTTSLAETAPGGGGTCPNEQLRVENNSTQLPECRAYEQVTPAYKEGYAVSIFRAAAAGDHVFLTSFANLGNEGSGHVSTGTPSAFLNTRTPSGWQATSINPPESQYVGQHLESIEPVSGLSLWTQHTPQESFMQKRMYVRSAGTKPQYSLVGPLNVPFVGETQDPSNEMFGYGSRPVAATDDFGHVIVTSDKNETWPFDLTTHSQPKSLYEYSGRGNSEPILVGVQGSEKGSTELIGRCGTELGSGASMYNALSSDGQTVFFTVLPKSSCGLSAPETTEVYARSYGALTDADAAETIDVSASECTVGGSECTDESGKNFEGASEDGSRVFFTSTQKLTNEAVDATASGDATAGTGCTSSEIDCNLYEYRFGLTDGPDPRRTSGSLHLVAGGEVRGVAGIAEDGSRIYFVSRNALAGAGVNEFKAAPQVGESNLYVYDTHFGKTSFIGTLSSGDRFDWWRSFAFRPVEVGGEDGRYLLFESFHRGLTPDDTSSINQLFEYDAVTGELVRVTQGEDGYNQDGNSAREGISLTLEGGLAGVARLDGLGFKSADRPSNMSADGHTIAFVTGGRLSPRAISSETSSPEEGACRSVYEFHSDGPISDGSVRLISDGRDTQLYNGTFCGVVFEGIDASGYDIMFSTFDPLVRGDTDGGQVDVYDARVDGGFPARKVASGCQGDCLGSPVVSPSLEAPASASFTGVGNTTSSMVSSRGIKSLSRARRLKQALQRCKQRPKRRRKACEKSARARYGQVARRAKRTNGRRK